MMSLYVKVEMTVLGWFVLVGVILSFVTDPCMTLEPIERIYREIEEGAVKLQCFISNPSPNEEQSNSSARSIVKITGFVSSLSFGVHGIALETKMQPGDERAHCNSTVKVIHLPIITLNKFIQETFQERVTALICTVRGENMVSGIATFEFYLDDMFLQRKQRKYSNGTVSSAIYNKFEGRYWRCKARVWMNYRNGSLNSRRSWTLSAALGTKPLKKRSCEGKGDFSSTTPVYGVTRAVRTVTATFTTTEVAKNCLEQNNRPIVIHRSRSSVYVRRWYAKTMVVGLGLLAVRLAIDYLSSQG